jgi:hypothetical protein
VLTEDPDLGHGLSGERLRAAERACLARVVVAPRGYWRNPDALPAVEGSLGLLMLRGLLSRRVGRRGRFGAELLGPGDLLRPWDDPTEQADMAFTTDWRVIQVVRFADLDRRFALRAAPYPEIAAQLLRRTVLRARRLATTMAIVHEPKIEARVHTVLWALAERWGKVTPDGVTVTLPLTHALLADMVAASRPAVTAALSALRCRSRLHRDGDLWLLRGGPPSKLENAEGA